MFKFEVEQRYEKMFKDEKKALYSLIGTRV